MSGIVGIFNPDGAPVDRELLERMTCYLAFRGPDAQETWLAGNVGFGHTMLRTTWESEHERQPCSLDGRVWICADARVDAQEDLVRELAGRGREVKKGIPDPELILHAYHAWGVDCLDHLLGDFTFAIWDGPNRRLFCARDQFGVKPFYYAHLDGTFVFSNTLRCVRLHPAVSDELNDLAIADFLLFDVNQDVSTTTFADIRRIPPGHRLVFESGEPHVNCYWTLPIEEPLFYKRSEEYVERFKELLRTAVKDRLRTDKLVVYMSGGLDSPALAATARDIFVETAKPFDLRALTCVYDRLIPDQERYYAGLVAEKLRIPIHFLAADDYKLYERWDQPELLTPEPSHNPRGLAQLHDNCEFITRHSRVVFDGEGPDNLLSYDWPPYVKNLLKRRMFWRLTTDVLLSLRAENRVPLVRSLVLKARRLISDEEPADHGAFPGWLNLEFAARLKLPERFREYSATPASPHLFRPRAYASVTGSYAPLWQRHFEFGDAGVTGFAFESRYPCMDIRMARYMLALPPLPWARAKFILRRASRGVLPAAVLERRKSPLAGCPEFECARRDGLPAPTGANLVSRYVRTEAISSAAGTDPDGFWIESRPLSLNQWLQCDREYGRIPRRKAELR